MKGYKIKCATCGKVAYVRVKSRKTCSYDCRKKYNNKKALERTRTKQIRTYKEEKRKCANCRKEFIWSSSRPQQRFCSKECSAKFFKKKHEKISKGIIKRSNGKYENFLKLRFEIFKRDNFTCQYCGRNVRDDGIKLQADHIIPRSKGGKDIFSNFITACEECNLGKGDILLSEHLKIKKNKVKNG